MVLVGLVGSRAVAFRVLVLWGLVGKTSSYQLSSFPPLTPWTSPKAPNPQIIIGFLYDEVDPTGNSWQVESWTQFKLAIMDINKDPTTLPGYVVNYSIADVGGTASGAMAGAKALLEAGAVGIVGTGSTSELVTAPSYCSMMQKPIMSPGSSGLNLVDKTNYPYLFRNYPSDAGVLKGMIALQYAMGWMTASVMVNAGFEPGWTLVLRPAMQALGMTYLSLVYNPATQNGKLDPVADQQITGMLELTKASGYKVVLLYAQTSDVAFLDAASIAAGLRGPQYAWMTTYASYAGIWTNSSGLIFVQTSVSTPLAAQFAARWPTVALKWQASVDGEFDPVTKMPFYGSSIYSGIVWDTDYSNLTGDGQPDFYGEYAYDAAWIYAKALDSVVRAGGSPYDGVAFRKALLATNYLGVQGLTVFDQTYQDRTDPVSAFMTLPMTSPATNTAPTQVVATATPLLTSLPKFNSTWCITGCLTLNSAMVWPQGSKPGDGRAIDASGSLTTFTTSPAIDNVNPFVVSVDAHNSFGQTPCSNECAQSTQQCLSCWQTVSNYQALSVSVTDAITGAVLAPNAPVSVAYVSTTGIVTLKLPQGVSSGSVLASVDVKYNGQSLPGSPINVTHLPCPAGYQLSASGTTCDPCAPGLFRNLSTTTCQLCPVNTFSSTDGSTACTACPTGSWQLANGQPFCQCKVGYYKNPHDPSSSGSVMPCMSCSDTVLPGGTTQYPGAADSSSCTCPPDTYHWQSDIGQPPSCRSCDTGLVCPGYGPPLQAAQYKAGLQYNGVGSPISMVLCETSFKCPANLPLNSCAANRVGVACDDCAADSAENSNGDCTPCTDPSSLVAPWIISCVFVVLFICALLFVATRKNRVQHDSFITIALIFTIMANTFQTLGVFENFHMNWPEPLGTLKQILLLMTLNVKLLRLPCIFHANAEWVRYLICHTVYPLTASAVLLTCLIVKFSGFRELPWTSIKNTQGIVLLTCSLSLAILSVEPLQCQLNPDGTSNMFALRNIQCWKTTEHQGLVVLAAFGILFYFAGALSLVIYVTTTAVSMQARPGGIQWMKGYKFILSRFVPQRYFYAIIWSVKNICIALVPIIFVRSPEAQIMVMTIIVAVVYGLQCALWPWRTTVANVIDAFCSVCLLLTLAVGGIIMGFTGQTDQSQTQATMQGFLLVIVPIMLLGCGSVGLAALGYSLMPKKQYSIFLSHHKLAAAVLSRWMKLKMGELISMDKVFVDSDNLTDLTALFQIVGFETQCIVIILTKETLYRIWCAGEIAVAFRQGLQIIPLVCNDYEAPTAADIDALGDCWTDAQKAEVAGLGIELEDIQDAYRKLTAMEVMKFDRDAEIEQQEEMVRQIVRKVSLDESGFNPLLKYYNRFRYGSVQGSRNSVMVQEGTRGALQRADVAIIGDVHGVEARCTCYVMQRLVEIELREKKYEHTTKVLRRNADVRLQLEGGHCALVVLTKGVLHQEDFQEAMVEAKDLGLQVIPIVAENGFTFPDTEFYNAMRANASERGKEHVEWIEEVITAYRSTFAILALRFSAHSSLAIQRTEIAEMVNRLTKMGMCAGEGAQWKSSVSTAKSSGGDMGAVKSSKSTRPRKSMMPDNNLNQSDDELMTRL